MKYEKILLAFGMFSALAILLLGFLGTTAFCAGGPGGGNMSNSWDLGDIRGSYWTSYYDYTNSSGSFLWTQLGANLSGSHKIDSVSVYFQPYYIYNWDGDKISRTQDGYEVREYFSGNLSDQLTTADLGGQYQQNEIDARGLYISESTGMFGYNNGKDPSKPEITLQGDANVAIKNFVADYAYGKYEEWNSNGLDTTKTSFGYNVYWRGDFLPGTLPAGMVAPDMSVSVPEPSVLCMIGFAAICGVIVWRRKR